MPELYHDNTYLALVQDVLSNGTAKGDRTGTGTISVFARQMRFDLRGGSIPLLTTKKMHTRSIIHEIIWYLRGDTSSNKLEQNGVSIWKEWKDQDGYLGPIYGEVWRSFPPPEGYFPVPRRIVVDNTVTRQFNGQVDLSHLPNGKYTGMFFVNIQGLEYMVLGVDGQQTNGKNSRANTYAIRFTQSGWVKRNVSTRHVREGRFVDQSRPSVYAVGILGDYASKRESITNKRLRRVWEQMISRCYNTNDASYHNYGGKGVKVCNRWLVLSDFIEDVRLLPNWLQAKNNEGFELDKDYYGYNDIYHPSACVWMRKEHNNQNKNTNIPVVLSNDQTKKFFPSVCSAAEFLGVSQTPIRHRIRHNLNTQLRGFKVSQFNDPAFVIRPLPAVDQIATAIKQLRTNPNDRRIIVSAWHPSLTPMLEVNVSPNDRASLGYQSLPPCHAMFQFYSRELDRSERMLMFAPGQLDITHEIMDQRGYPRRALSCHLYQRSCDVGLGVPFNIVQYSILTHMIAQVTNHVAEEFIWTGGDVHIYNNHVDALAEQLKRTPLASPQLELNPEVKEIDDFKYEDFKIVNYNSHPTIKMEVSV